MLIPMYADVSVGLRLLFSQFLRLTCFVFFPVSAFAVMPPKSPNDDSLWESFENGPLSKSLAIITSRLSIIVREG